MGVYCTCFDLPIAEYFLLKAGDLGTSKMASKCWFVLQQTHYPPPVIPKNGTGTSSGPICLGHLIPDLKHLDNVVNRHGPLWIPLDMPIYPTKAWDLTWEVNKNKRVDISGNAGVPIAAAAGLIIKQDAESPSREQSKISGSSNHLTPSLFNLLASTLRTASKTKRSPRIYRSEAFSGHHLSL